tara:strand:- start:2537 stop:3967 length:1431 start_codon:yes stop_codon:yes gene_type:complete
MAKGLSYSPNEALIRGAAAIGLSKMPADQTALGKIAELGAGILKEEGERRQKAEDAIDNTIAQVLADDGTLSDQHFAIATKQAQEYKQSYMQGVYMNNDEGNILKQKALNNLQRLANSSNEETVLRKTLAKQKEDGLLSDNLDITTFNAYLEHDYILKYEDGKKIYEINGVDYTYDDIKLFAKDLKNLDIKTTNDKQIDSLPYYIKHNKETNTKTFDSERFNRISLDSIADTERGFANQMRDNTIGGQQISDLIMNSSTIVEEFEQEFPGFEFVDANGDGVIDRSEKLDMIADAVLNTTNSAFNLENSRQIIADLLTADARNKAQRDGLLYVEPEGPTGPTNITDYSQYIYVPNIKEGDTGEEVQISGDQRRKMQKNINDKTRNFQGTNGYYVRLSGTKDGKQMYFRFDSFEQYQQVMDKDNKDGKYYGGKIPSKKENFDKLFPDAKGGYGYNRYIDEARLTELEVGGKINLPLDN